MGKERKGKYRSPEALRWSVVKVGVEEVTGNKSVSLKGQSYS